MEADKFLIVRLRGVRLGGHTHMRVFVQRAEYGRDPDQVTCGKAGDLCMENDEAEAFITAMMKADLEGLLCLTVEVKGRDEDGSL